MDIFFDDLTRGQGSNSWMRFVHSSRDISCCESVKKFHLNWKVYAFDLYIYILKYLHLNFALFNIFFYENTFYIVDLNNICKLYQ